MNNTDNIALKLDHLKKLVKESGLTIEAGKDDEKKKEKEPDIQDILDKIVDYAKLAGAYIDLSLDDKEAPSLKDLVKDTVQSVLYWNSRLEELYHKQFGGGEEE